MILTYPVISVQKEWTHKGTHDNLIGEDASVDLEKLMSIDGQVTADYSPTYLWCGDADQTVSQGNTHRMAAALARAGVKHRCPLCCTPAQEFAVPEKLIVRVGLECYNNYKSSCFDRTVEFRMGKAATDDTRTVVTG